MAEYIEVEGPDGAVFEFPNDMDMEAIRIALQDYYSSDTLAPAKDDGEMPLGEMFSQALKNTPESAGQFVEDLAQPFLHPIDTVTNMYELGKGVVNLLIPGDHPSEEDAKAVGQFMVDRYGSVEAAKRTFASDPVGMISDVAGVLTGGGMLAAKVPGTLGKIGRVAGKVGTALEPSALPMRATGRVMNPKTPDAVTTLMDEGVTPTAGQIMGGIPKAVEDKLTSVPLMGDAINTARRRANTQLNTAAYNRALNPIGETAADLPVGPEGIAAVSDRLAEAYETLLPKLQFTPDAKLHDDVVQIVSNALDNMPETSGRTLERILDTKLAPRVGEVMTGEQLKALQSDLGKLADNYKSSALASERSIGEALSDIDGALREGLIRANPQHAGQLRAIDQGYANYVRIRNAGSRTGDQSTGFSPAQLNAAVKASDKSVGKGNTARGRATMQDLSSAGVEVLGTKTPDSGTAGRLATGGAALGGAYYVDPVVAATLAASTTPYLPGMQRMVASILANRPKAARGVGRAVGKYGPHVNQAAFQMGRAEGLPVPSLLSENQNEEPAVGLLTSPTPRGLLTYMP